MTAPAPRNHPAESGAREIRVTVEIDSDDLRRHAEQHAQLGNDGVAHVLFTAAAHMEAGGEIPPWIGTVVDDDERLTGPRLEPMVAHPAPTPSPVAVPVTLAHLLEHLDEIEGSRVKVSDDYEFWVHSPEQVGAWLKAHWSGPTVDPRPEPVMDGPSFGDYWTPDPEPVVAPLPSEVGTVIRATVGFSDGKGYEDVVELMPGGVWRGSQGSVTSDCIDSWVRMLPEGDQGTKAEPARLRIEAGWLVREENACTCNGGDAAANGAHEPGCGLIPELHLSTLPGWPTVPEDDEDTVRAVDALSTAREEIRARRREFDRLGADDQYLNALDDAFGLVSNLWRSHGGEGR